MKYRTDFVTNSSSASYIVEIDCIPVEGETQTLQFTVPPDVSFGMDLTLSSDEEGFYYYRVDDKAVNSTVKETQELMEIILTGFQMSKERDLSEKEGGAVEETDEHVMDPKKEKEGHCRVRRVSHIKEIQELMDILYEELYVGEFDDEEEESFFQEEVPFKKVEFDEYFNSCKEELKKEFPTLDNLKSVAIRNIKCGNGDSASWIPFEENPVLREYYQKYHEADTNEKDKVLTELKKFIESEPVMNWKDHDGEMDGPRRIFWNDDEEALHRFLYQFFNERESDRLYWMAYPTTRYELDMRTGRVEESVVLALF